MINTSTIIHFIIIIISIAFILCIGFYFSKKNLLFFRWNQGHEKRSLILYFVGLAISSLYAFIPFYAVPFGFLAIILVIFSNSYFGYIMYLSYLCLYNCFFTRSMEEFIVLLLIGALGSTLFATLNKEFRYGGALCSYLIMDFALYFLVFLSDSNTCLVGDFILYSAIRIFVLFILLTILMKIMNDSFICKNDHFYVSINDPDHELLISLKYIDENAYFHAVHTAYLSDKAARLIHADASLAKALGYYHRIGLLQGEDNIQNTLTVAATYHFPEELQNAMREFGIKNTEHVSKEAAIVQICDALVSSLTYLFQKDLNAQLNYEKIIDVIIKKKLDCNDLASCDLTLCELTQIKKGLVEEKLYYDFLR